MSSTTHDALFGGRVVLEQPGRGEGYRANVDALLLAAFAARGRAARRVIDLGAGAGAVSLCLLHWEAAGHAVLVEIDSAATTAARANLAANGWSSRGDVVCADARRLPEKLGRADLVVCNPPFVPPGHGRPPARPENARARMGELSLFTAAARAVLDRRGRACFVYPAHGLCALHGALEGAGLVPKRMRAVHADVETPARVVLLEARAGKPGGLSVLPPLFERDARGYLPEMARLLEGGLSALRTVDRAGSRTRRAR